LAAVDSNFCDDSYGMVGECQRVMKKRNHVQIVCVAENKDKKKTSYWQKKRDRLQRRQQNTSTTKVEGNNG